MQQPGGRGPCRAGSFETRGSTGASPPKIALRRLHVNLRVREHVGVSGNRPRQLRDVRDSIPRGALDHRPSERTFSRLGLRNKDGGERITRLVEESIELSGALELNGGAVAVCVAVPDDLATE